MPPKISSPLTVEEQTRVLAWVPIARQVASRYARVMETTGVGAYEDALSVAYEALCVAAKTWDPSRAYQARGHRYAQLICGQMVRHAINKTLTGAYNRPRDLQSPTHAVQVRPRHEECTPDSAGHSADPWPATCARIDVETLTERSGQHRGVSSLLSSYRGIPLRCHTTDPVSREAVRQRQLVTLKRLQEVADA